MVKINYEQVKKLFNEGKLKPSDAEFYYKQGIIIIIKGSKVIDVRPDPDVR